MPSAQYLADRMLDAVNSHSSILNGLAKGAMSLPVDFYYLGKDFLDTENSGNNYNDKFRFAELIKAGMANRESLQKIAEVFYQRFENRVDYHSLTNFAAHATGSVVGRYAVSQLMGMNMSHIFSSRVVAGFIAGSIMAGILTTGAAVSRAIYASRDLYNSAPDAWSTLRTMGNLDLLYFLVEDKVEPFNEAYKLALTDPREFDELCRLFLEEYEYQ